MGCSGVGVVLEPHLVFTAKRELPLYIVGAPGAVAMEALPDACALARVDDFRPAGARLAGRAIDAAFGAEAPQHLAPAEDVFAYFARRASVRDERRIDDHLALAAAHPAVARALISRPEPHMALQALAAALALGFRDVRLLGVHFAEEADEAFLNQCRAAFPDASIACNGAAAVAQNVRPKRAPVDTDKIIGDLRANLRSANVRTTRLTNEVTALRAEVQALRGSMSFRLGFAALQPLRTLRALLKGTNRAAAFLEARAEANVRADVSVICHETNSLTGHYRSALAYLDEIRREGLTGRLVVLQRRDPTQQRAINLPRDGAVIINSIASFEWKAVRDYCAAPPPNAWLFLHETQWVFERFESARPDLAPVVADAIRRMPVLAVSDAQAAFFRERFGAQKLAVVRELSDTANLDLRRLVRTSSADGAQTVLMVGSVQARKGVDLFSQVADLAARQGLPWRFRWVGRGSPDGLYLSPNVDWAGAKTGDDLAAAYLGASAFLLSSLDDPFPLSAIEAMSYGLRTIAFRGTGTAEVMPSLAGCEVYETHQAQEAFAALRRALSTQADAEAIHARARPFIDPALFARAVNGALGLTYGETQTERAPAPITRLASAQ